jgi:hypothetical protein
MASITLTDWLTMALVLISLAGLVLQMCAVSVKVQISLSRRQQER